MKPDPAPGRVLNPVVIDDRPGEFAPRPLRKGEVFETRDHMRAALKQRQHAVELMDGFSAFNTVGNVIESIIATDDATLFPLPDALEWLVKAFRTWRRAKGSLTMDQAMRLAPTGAGGETDATRSARIKRDQLIAKHMSHLTALGFSARAASGLIAVAIERTNLPPLGASRIAREWPRMQREYKNKPFGMIDGKEFGVLDIHAAQARAMTAAECKEYLRQYGGPALPKPKRKRDK